MRAPALRGESRLMPGPPRVRAVSPVCMYVMVPEGHFCGTSHGGGGRERRVGGGVYGSMGCESLGEWLGVLHADRGI